MTKGKRNQRRRYYMHRVMKRFCKVNSRGKQISITETAFNKLQPRHSSMIHELSRAGYSIQYAIPE